METVLVLVLSFTAAVTGAYAASPDAENTVVINLSNEGQHSVLHSSSFEAKDGQILTLKITSSIKGAADLFLFSPSNQEQRIPIGGNSETKTIPWAAAAKPKPFLYQKADGPTTAQAFSTVELSL